MPVVESVVDCVGLEWLKAIGSVWPSVVLRCGWVLDANGGWAVGMSWVARYALCFLHPFRWEGSLGSNVLSKA